MLIALRPFTTNVILRLQSPHHQIAEVVAQLEPLQALHASLTAERRVLESQLSSRPRHSHPSSSLSSIAANAIDYQSSQFPFSSAVAATLRNTFNLNKFRLCQEGVINAAVDDRDIVCVMPTGGGKSLTYQLPAVMGRGLTVVVSPLLALIWDQVRALKEIGIECVMLTGSTSTQEQNEIYARLRDGPSRGEKEIRPEKISKSKRFISALEKMNQSGQLNSNPQLKNAARPSQNTTSRTYHRWTNGESGIVYCLSKKTGVYHAGIDDTEKEIIHVRWREGKVNCICATIAFGLGIDKGDVRYVIQGYYQETGRAGRDGKDSDCVLFYRGQDATRLAGLIYTDVDGTGKLHEMLKFAQDLRTCRKVAFAKYFSASAHLSTASWDNPTSLSSSDSTSTSTSPCGICDNCLRPASSISTRDVTLESWKILRIAQEVVKQSGRVTLPNLASLVRGLGGGSFGVVGGGEGKKGRKQKSTGEKAYLDIEEFGGKVTMSADDVEVVITHLLLIGYLQDSYHATAFSVNVYVIPSPTAVRLTRLEREEIETGKGARVECTFVVPQGKEKKASGKGASKVGGKTAVKRKKREEGDEDGQADENGGRKLGVKKDSVGSGGRKLGDAKKAKAQTHPENEEREVKEYEYFSDVYDGLYSDGDLDRETDQHHGDDDRDNDGDGDGYGQGMEEDDEPGDDWDEMIGESWRDEGGWKVLHAGSGSGSGTSTRRARN
ncbi:ATP-dependent DNA helicase [Cryptococcus deuterogattii 99/473]|uniref:DNA 3'-5' helicase n=1 Tax=Cryptococcus deuterogattii Ram5 TaxID=1296110 RepID=A0A0D0URF0_9TREE|nr:ATP-dependent DNA helicase [Cryptococcus deuterogattii Ram5]KIY55407.1 ATP-dependent DNA helicase [Cryptococcus deuterogattii 99/473]